MYCRSVIWSVGMKSKELFFATSEYNVCESFTSWTEKVGVSNVMKPSGRPRVGCCPATRPDAASKTERNLSLIEPSGCRMS